MEDVQYNLTTFFLAFCPNNQNNVLISQGRSLVNFMESLREGVVGSGGLEGALQVETDAGLPASVGV